jgi:hypothetical protein
MRVRWLRYTARPPMNPALLWEIGGALTALAITFVAGHTTRKLTRAHAWPAGYGLVGTLAALGLVPFVKPQLRPQHWYEDSTSYLLAAIVGGIIGMAWAHVEAPENRGRWRRLSAYLRDDHAQNHDDQDNDDRADPGAGFEDVAGKLATREGRRDEREQQYL